MIFLTLILLIIGISRFGKQDSGLHGLILNRLVLFSLLISFFLLWDTFDLFKIAGNCFPSFDVWGGLYRIDLLTHLGDFILIGSAIFICLVSETAGSEKEIILEREKRDKDIKSEKLGGMEIPNGYPLFLLFSLFAMISLLGSNNLITMVLSIELQGLALYISATGYKNSEFSTSAGLKYFLLGSLSSCFLLLGTALVYYSGGITDFAVLWNFQNSQIPMVENLTYLSDRLGLEYPVINEKTGSGLVQVWPSIWGSRASISNGLNIGLIIICIGFLFKIAASPFHNWAPDVYDRVPTLVTNWFTVMPKIAILLFLLQFLGSSSPSVINPAISLHSNGIFPFLGNGSPGDPSGGISRYKTIGMVTDRNSLFLISSLLSLVVGTVGGLVQFRIKRLLAYSTISHVGFMLLSLAIETEQSIQAYLFYLIQYSLTTINIFAILIAFGRETLIAKDLVRAQESLAPYNGKGSKRESFPMEQNQNKNKNNKEPLDINSPITLVQQLEGMFNNYPMVAVALGISLFSVAGIPPLIGFFGKQMILFSALESGYYISAGLVILFTVVSASYYLRLIKHLFFGKRSLPDDKIMKNIGSLGNGEGNEKNKRLPASIPSEVGAPGEGGGLYGLYEYKYRSFSKIDTPIAWIISLITLIIVFFFFYPMLLINGIHLTTLEIFFKF